MQVVYLLPFVIFGKDKIYIGSGAGLPIPHIGKTILSSSPSSIELEKVLVVPQLKKNVLSVSG